MNDSVTLKTLDDELEAMNLSEEDAILKGMDDLDETEKEQEVEAKKAKKEKAEDEKKEPKYSKKELLEIFDIILFEGEYRETVKLGKNYTVKFRTRNVGESNDITRKVDALDLKTFLAIQNFTNVITLAYAICDINGQELMDLSFQDRYQKIKGLSESIIIVLSSKLFEFDKKVLAAMQEGQENF